MVSCTNMHDHADVTPSMAQLVRSRRKYLRLRQDEVAALADVSTRSVHAIESGKPTTRLDVLVAVLAVLGLTLRVVSPTESVDVR